MLTAKVAALAGLVRRSRSMVVYSGAGISTAAGIDDYATRTGGAADRPHLASPYLAQPTRAHRVCVALHAAGYVKRWVQQNHDGLPQKAGLPQSALNEIHGAWYDPSNPVVKMDGSLREDLFADLLRCEESVDLCLALGTSLAGMNADRVALAAARPGRLGLVLVGVQRTQHDGSCALRIFERLDRVLVLLAAELGLESDWSRPGGALPAVVPGRRAVPYGPDGRRLPGGATAPIDFSEGASLVITAGPYAGAIATVANTDAPDGQIDLRVRVRVKGSFFAHVPMKLGSWWVREAVAGTLDRLCVAAAPAEQ